jgi:hypothetical protein
MQSDLARSGKLMGIPNLHQPSVFPIQSYKVRLSLCWPTVANACISGLK